MAISVIAIVLSLLSLFFSGRALWRMSRQTAAEEAAIALCNARNEEEQNYYRRKLGIMLCGWPDE